MFSGTTIQFQFDRTRDPVKNLQREDEIFDRVEAGRSPELVRLWINSECLVRGKAKSPRYGWYREDVAKELGVRVIQRETGGGVVYHDQGNLNWSLFTKGSGRLLSPTQLFEGASSLIVKTLEGLGVPAEFASPNRIDVEGYKVSGLAARSTPRARLVHGTLLLHSDLEKLNRLCIPPPGCPPVANLEKWAPDITPSRIARALEPALKEEGFEVRRVSGLRDRLSSERAGKPS